MKISPVTNHLSKWSHNTNFKGTIENYTDTKPYIQMSPSFHPDSSIERTLGIQHQNRTGKIYFADPMEPISEEQKKSFDYIVYDNEPLFPDIENDIAKAYFESTIKNIRQQFINIQEYFQRREQAGWADKQHAKDQQWKASQCLVMYDKARQLITQRNSLEGAIKTEKNRLKDTENSIDLRSEFLNANYQKLDKAKEMAENTEEEKKEKFVKIFNIQSRIIELYRNIEDLKKTKENKEALITEQNKCLNDIRKDLAPLFDDIKTFYEDYIIDQS